MDVDVPDASQNYLCPHIDAVFAVEAERVSMLKKYKAAVVWATQMGARGERAAKKRKMPTCGTCNLVLHRPFICLHCSFGGCWRGGHIVNHLRDLNHHFCADVKSGSVYCVDCDNIIFDATFSDLYHNTILSVEERETYFLQSRKQREVYKSWKPDARDAAALESSVPISCHSIRGLLNLGQTCFLNVVLQALIHNPLLRNFFLSDKHNNSSKACKLTQCMNCEMDKLFAEVYSGNKAPYGPASLLATTWSSSSDLAGYSQQDSHEFFIAALNQLHSTALGSTLTSCNCIVHEAFEGQYHSECKCDRCGKAAVTNESFFDISLQLKGKNGDVMEADTLPACLRRFIHPEIMKFTCSSCKSPQSGTKRLSIRKLPAVLSFQFKRFEHDGQNGKSSSRKIDTHVRFPASLNMLPYTTLMVKSNPDKETYFGPETMYDYDLFAVINHEGQMDNGHYYNYARSQDEWNRFDDDKVTPSTLEAALNSNAYMCFYVKRHLNYRPFAVPSYKVTRETEAVKEKEKKEQQEAARMKEVEDALLALS